MANRFARKNGNWNASDVWSDTPSGSASASFIPTTGDVAMANSFTVTVNVNATCSEVRTDTTGGATTGGGFTLASGVTLTSNCYAGGSNCVTFNSSSPAVAYIVGDVYANQGVGGYDGAYNGSTGTLNITGNVFGGTGNAQGAENATTGIVNITGTVTAGFAFAAYGALNTSTGTINVTGNAIGGSFSSANGVHNSGTGIITVSGNAIGGTAGYGAYNANTGVMSVGCAVGNDYGLGYSTNNGVPGVFGYGINTGAAQATTKVKSIRYGAKGQSPTAGLVQLDVSDLANSTAVFVEPTTFANRTFGPAENIGGQPAASNVRSGTAYNFGSTIGTCHVPAAASVLYGVPVDATTGTATITASDIRAAIGLASANLDSQLADLPTAAENATAVWGNATRTLTESSGGGASAEDVWTYATRSLTEAPDVPTVEEIAAEVRTELTPELSRVANCATVESTGDQLAGLL